MFKKKKTAAPAAIPAMQAEAAKAVARGERIREAAEAMDKWHQVGAGCKAGNIVTVEINDRSVIGYDPLSAAFRMFPSRMSFCIDADTAPLWAAFARQMGDERERRLKDVLGA